jgi:hypothetical protein
MRFTTITFFTILTTLTLRPAEAQTLYTCGQGTVRAVETITQMVGRPLATFTIDPLGEPQELVERPPDEPSPAYLVTVKLFNAIYTAEAFANDPENFDPTRLTENDPISICVNRDQMVLDRGDGTDFRAKIIRAEHVRRPTGTR